MTRSDPNDEAAVLDTPAPAFSIEEARRIARQCFAIEAGASPLASERDQNFRLSADDGREYVLKIANRAEQPEVLAFQTAALRHVEKRAPELPVPRVIPGVDGEDLTWVDADDAEDGRYLVRAVTYLPGAAFQDVAPTAVLRQEVGALLAGLDVALGDFLDPPPAHELLWDLSHAARLQPLVERIDDEAGRRMVSQVLDDFEGHVQPRRHSLRAQVIHNDFNRGNLLVADDDRHPVCGIIDFGDMVHAPLINDLAIAVAYQLIDEPEPLAAARDVVSAYQGVNPLVEEEVALLYDLVGTRMAQSLAIGAWRADEHPDNAAYILTDQAAFLGALARWRDLDRSVVTASLRAVCGMPGRDASAETGEALAQRRRRALGRALRLTYDEPLHIVRGEGVWLYDHQGRQFLDAYNNVACVGHSHPGVVAALTRQAKTLNTNTRYLHEHIVEYAERLTATLPDPLSVCMFVCTGTEANDLAWQIARACTGGDGAIVTEHAYHGNSVAVSQLSPEELLPGLGEDWVASVPAPNVYSGRFRLDAVDAAAIGERYAACVDDAIDTLRERGHRPAGFIVDTVYTSDGIFVAPDGYLDSAWQRVRAAGGLCIADEVQAGFGRSGDFMWGFEQQGVVPDIVTLGKPIGNGHPLAAVITTPEIASQFAERRYYFNTFGGNPVSCAVGLSVLEILQREALQENARVTGRYLRSLVSALMDRHPVIGDVRGAGLMLAVELVQDPQTREPATGLCMRVVNAMREAGVLIGRTGLHGQVLKIRPPLVFSRANADLLASRLDEVLADLAPVMA
jgi:4-aminobutyrate aminotransferase-like enzyme/Ser/Thr protein kinase RdoA (MazF antagonist)